MAEKLTEQEWEEVSMIRTWIPALALSPEEGDLLLRALAEREAERNEARTLSVHWRMQSDELQTHLLAAREMIRRLREALTKIKNRALHESPDDVEAEVASGRTINDMYVLAKAALAAQPDAGVGEGKRCSGCGGRGRHAFGCPRDFSSPPAPHAGQEGTT